MFTKNILAFAALTGAGLAATNFHVNKGCVKVGGTHEQCDGDDAYSINGNEAQITCKLDANPTLVLVSWPAHYGDIYWGEDDCLYDAQGININGQCA